MSYFLSDMVYGFCVFRFGSGLIHRVTGPLSNFYIHLGRVLCVSLGVGAIALFDYQRNLCSYWLCCIGLFYCSQLLLWHQPCWLPVMYVQVQLSVRLDFALVYQKWFLSHLRWDHQCLVCEWNVPFIAKYVCESNKTCQSLWLLLPHKSGFWCDNSHQGQDIPYLIGKESHQNCCCCSILAWPWELDQRLNYWRDKRVCNEWARLIWWLKNSFLCLECSGFVLLEERCPNAVKL